MTPSDPGQVHRRFRAVVARGLSRAEREERTHLEALRALPLRALPEEITLPVVVPLLAMPRSWPSPSGPVARSRAVAVRKRKRVIAAKLGRLISAKKVPVR